MLAVCSLAGAGCESSTAPSDPTAEEGTALTGSTSIRIDATGLTPQGLYINNGVRFDSSAIKQLSIDPGTYALELAGQAGIAWFTVDPNGTVRYDASLQGGVFTGQGTSTLTVVPHAVTVDASGLSETSLLLYNARNTPQFDSKTVLNLRLAAAPSAYVMATTGGASVGAFTVKPDGTIAYDASLAGVYAGAGSKKLTVVPHPITLDATALTEVALDIYGVGGAPGFDSKTVLHFDLAAASKNSYTLATRIGAVIGAFTVKPDGSIGLGPSVANGVFTVSNKTTLKVVPHPVTIDATGLPRQELVFFGGTNTPHFDSGTVQHYQLAANTPQGYIIETFVGGVVGAFNVKPSGAVDYPSSANTAFAGRNSTKIGILTAPGGGSGGNPIYAAPAQYTIPYHGGDLMGMPGPISIYLLFYGTWSDDQRHYFQNLSEHIGDSAWFSTLTQYKDHTGTAIKSGTRFGGLYNDNYSKGKHLDDGTAVRDVQAVLGAAFNSTDPQHPPLPRDSNGVYVVFTSPDVTFTSSVDHDGCYCGYHATSLIGAQKYAVMVGNNFIYRPTTFSCPAGGVPYLCEWMDETCTSTAPPYACSNKSGPTGTIIDGMASTFLHEIAEAMTDPDVSGGSGYFTDVAQYASGAGDENGDVCNWNDGLSTLTAPNGAPYNLKIGDQLYRVQQLPTMNASSQGYCSMGAPYAATDNVIGVQSAVYGDNCTSSAFADITRTVGQRCNGLASCSITLDRSLLTGYAGPTSCARQFTAQWACWDGAHSVTIDAEAAGKSFTLTCP